MQVFSTIPPIADLVNPATTSETADSTLTDASGAHSPSLATDDDLLTWFGSSGTGASAWLEIDLGTKAPYYDVLSNITVFNRWALLLRGAVRAVSLGRRGGGGH
jgi:hypothetical protein